jgi:hypothetical protein
MKKWFVALLVLGWLIPAGLAWAKPPVQISHTITSFTTTDAATVNYTLNVKNTGTGSISNMTLSLDPLPFTQDQITLNIATIEPQAEAQIPFTITTREHIEQNIIRHMPLMWRCEGTVSGAGPVIFPVVSIEGGSR